VESVALTANQAADLKPDRISVFGYAHVPWFKRHQKMINDEDLPGIDARYAQATTIERELNARGYASIGLDHFALEHDELSAAAAKGIMRRNFQGYTTDRAPVLLGLGASAIGALPQGYAQNLPDERAWLAAVEAGRLPVGRGLLLTEDDRIRRAIIEAVMCDLELDLVRVPDAVWRSAEPRLAPLLADGLAALTEGKLKVTALGRRFVRHVASCFDARLGAAPARHSSAV
jgi:oxygen-independent coproporphyrinogen-3 oxidase